LLDALRGFGFAATSVGSGGFASFTRGLVVALAAGVAVAVGFAVAGFAITGFAVTGLAAKLLFGDGLAGDVCCASCWVGSDGVARLRGGVAIRKILESEPTARVWVNVIYGIPWIPAQSP
jgi:hypothetical protein